MVYQNFIMDYYLKKSENVQCLACKHYCIIPKGKFGVCGVRKNVGGKIELITYSKPSVINLDPIEKKPLYHYFPGTKSLSIGFYGCNFKCEFCQNYSISCTREEKLEKLLEKNEKVSPKEFVLLAKDKAKSVAFTYNEPAISIEYCIDAINEAKKQKVGTVFVSNGYSSEESVKELKGKLGVINIDLKSFNERFYKKICGAKLENVLETIKNFHKTKTWVELSTLIIPDKNDSKEELLQIAEFILSIDKNIPWHIIGFFPTHKMTTHYSAMDSHIKKAVDIGKEVGLNYIYSRLPDGQNTYCSNCGKLLINRSFYGGVEILFKNNKCECGKRIKGTFS
jgi:pyruvate formate lyase activating enzyme